MTEKRKRIQEKMFEVIALLDDKKGYNLQKYKDMFDEKNMSDEEFGKFCNWCNDPKDFDQLDHTIYIQAMPFEEPSIQNTLKALQVLGVPDEEYTYFNVDGKGYIRSRYPIPVGFINIKRLEQLLSKKNRYSLDNEKRSIKTDQVSSDSKIASISDSEAAALITHGLDNIFKEFYGPRSSDEKSRNEMYKTIARNGYVTLSDLEDPDRDSYSKNTLNTFDTYLISAGLKTDLITDGLKTPYTIKKELGK